MESLQKFLRKLGVNSYLDLTLEEKETYKLWEEALTGKKLTDEDVSVFFSSQIEDVLDKLPNDQNGEKLDTFLKMKLELLRSCQSFLNTPKLQKEMTEKEIELTIQKLG